MENNKTKMLVVVDVQNDFISGVLGSDDARRVVPKIAKFLELHGREYNYIYITQDTHWYDYPTTIEGNYLPVEHCIEYTPGWCIEENVAKTLYNIEHDKLNTLCYIKKDKFCANIADKIRYTMSPAQQSQLERVDFCGFCTDICVLANAIDLKNHTNIPHIRVFKDLCAGSTPENNVCAFNTMNCCHIETLCALDGSTII